MPDFLEVTLRGHKLVELPGGGVAKPTSFHPVRYFKVSSAGSGRLTQSWFGKGGAALPRTCEVYEVV